MATYKIVRFLFQGGNIVIKRDLSLEEAKEYCRSPETSSMTATFEGADLVNNGKPWFEGL